MDEYAIRAEHLSCHFGVIRAVDDLSLEIPKGIIFGFLGPNGSGKTTTIRLLLGLLEPSQGSASVLGFDTRTQSEQIRDRCGALLEHTGLYERLSANDNLEFYGRVYRMERPLIEARIEELLTHFGLWERRQCILVTNNEVAADEQVSLRKADLRPGDADWEKWGICDYITKPRIATAITGKTPTGNDIEGDYKFTDEFPMAEGFEENAEFFTLTYETPIAVSHHRAFARIAPLLWMRAGSTGRRIEQLPDQGWDVADTYGLLTDLDQAAPFCDAVEARNTIQIAFIVTDDDRRFQSIARRLPNSVQPVRLYESYLTNFRFSFGQ
jgi:hypothetical protein